MNDLKNLLNDFTEKKHKPKDKYYIDLYSYKLLSTPKCEIYDSWYELGKLPIDYEFDFDELWDLHPDELGKIKIMGKVIDTPRYQESYGQSYFFTGANHEAKPIDNQFLKDLLKYVNKISKKERKSLKTKLKYKQILINWYRDGSDYIGWHSDDTTQLVDNSPIYSFTFGASRKFKIKSKENGSVKDIILSDRSVIVMGGSFQEHYQHCVPKTNTDCGRRINITMRLFDDH